MAWSWSHTGEAYQYAREQVQSQPRDWLEAVWAEWQALSSRERCADGFSESKYDRALSKAKKLPVDVLADAIWDRMEEMATCTNGGWEAHCCPFACMGHMVPFGPEREED